jgi:hypothetical protein
MFVYIVIVMFTPVTKINHGLEKEKQDDDDDGDDIKRKREEEKERIC